MNGPMLRWLLAHALPGPDSRRGPARLTIIRHHRVYAAGETALYRLGVDENVFEAQVATCVEVGMPPITVSEGLEWLGTARHGQRVAFSFDDGYEDNVTRALPILNRHGARATFFLAAGLIDERRAPWWDELAHVLEYGTADRATLPTATGPVELDRSTAEGRRLALRALLPWLRVEPGEQRSRLERLGDCLRCSTTPACALADWPTLRRLADSGMEIGAHTLGHPFLSLLAAGEQLREIRGSVERIAERLGVDVTGLAYPGGDHDDTTRAMTRQSGLAWAVTTRSGDVRPGDDRHRLDRRGLPEGAVMGPGGRFSSSMTRAELAGRFDRLRGRRAEVTT